MAETSVDSFTDTKAEPARSPRLCRGLARADVDEAYRELQRLRDRRDAEPLEHYAYWNADYEAQIGRAGLLKSAYEEQHGPYR